MFLLKIQFLKGYIAKTNKNNKMEKTSQVLKFDQFERLYESYNFVNEAEDVLFTPDDLTVSAEDLEATLTPQGATGEEEKNKPVEEALDPKAFAPIKRGEKSDRVKQLQKDLNLSPQDGIFGEGTEAEVKAFQKKNNLTADGKVGIQTLRKMLELKGDKNPESTITTKYKSTSIKTAAQAKSANIDPALLELFDVTLVSNGTEQFVIMIAKKDTATKAKAIQKSKIEIPEWMKGLVTYVAASASPSAFIATKLGITLASVVDAKAMISGVASAAKFVVGGAAYVVGAVVQGMQTVANWYVNQVKSNFQKISSGFKELFTLYCNGFAAVAKSSMQALTAYMNGLKTAGLVLTGAALKAFKAVSSKLAPAIKTIVDGAKDAAAFIQAGIDSIAKQGNEAVVKFKKEIQDGWNTVKSTTQKAYTGVKTAVKSAGENVAKAAEQAYNDTASWLNSCYEEGLKFWESLTDAYGDPIFESSFDDLDFSIA